MAGKSYAAVSQYFTAAKFFIKVKEFDAILSMPIDAEYIGNQKEKYILEFIRDLADQCPEETLMKYSVYHAYVLLLYASRGIFRNLLEAAPTD